MIYLLYGTDSQKSRNKLHDLVTSLVKKKPDASHIRLNDETFSDASLEENISGVGLFSQKTIVEMDNVFRNKDAKVSLLERLKDIAQSENIFVILEGELTKAELTKFEKHSEKVQEFSLQEETPKAKDFNVFSLTDALGKRDRKHLWVLFMKARAHDIAPEEIHGILFWQIKAMLATMQSKSPKEAGLNPFVYQKSGGFLRNFTPQEIQDTSVKLIELYHNARRGIVDFDRGLERFILEV